MHFFATLLLAFFVPPACSSIMDEVYLWEISNHQGFELISNEMGRIVLLMNWDTFSITTMVRDYLDCSVRNASIVIAKSVICITDKFFKVRVESKDAAYLSANITINRKTSGKPYSYHVVVEGRKITSRFMGSGPDPCLDTTMNQFIDITNTSTDLSRSSITAGIAHAPKRKLSIADNPYFKRLLRRVVCRLLISKYALCYHKIRKDEVSLFINSLHGVAFHNAPNLEEKVKMVLSPEGYYHILLRELTKDPSTAYIGMPMYRAIKLATVIYKRATWEAIVLEFENQFTISFFLADSKLVCKFLLYESLVPEYFLQDDAASYNLDFEYLPNSKLFAGAEFIRIRRQILGEHDPVGILSTLQTQNQTLVLNIPDDILMSLFQVFLDNVYHNTNFQNKCYVFVSYKGVILPKISATPLSVLVIKDTVNKIRIELTSGWGKLHVRLSPSRVR